MVTQVVQPPQPVANCFQLLKLLGGTIKIPHVYGLRERENYWYYTLLVFPIQVWFPVPPALSQFIVGNPCFLEIHIPLYVISYAPVWKESQRGKGWMDPDDGLRRPWKDQVISPCVTFVHAIYNTEVPCCSRNKRVSVCLYVWEYLLYKHSLWFI